jgi:hypothetical protein
MLKTPFVMDFVPVAGGTATRAKENVPAIAVEVSVEITIEPLPPCARFATQPWAPTVSVAVEPAVGLLTLKIPGPAAPVTVRESRLAPARVTLSDPPNVVAAPSDVEVVVKHAAVHDVPLIRAPRVPVAVVAVVQPLTVVTGTNPLGTAEAQPPATAKAHRKNDVSDGPVL